MNTSRLITHASARKPLRVVAFYTDFPAGVHAKTVADAVFKKAGPDFEGMTEFWKLDSIPSVGPLRNLIIKEAQGADAWIIASSSLCEWDALILQWMNWLTAKDAFGRAPALLVGLFGNAMPTNGSGNFNWFLDLLTLLALHTGQQFIWQHTDRALANNLQWLQGAAHQIVSEKLLLPPFVADHLHPHR